MHRCATTGDFASTHAQLRLVCAPCLLLNAAGNLPVDLALSLASVIMSLLYAPKARALDSPMLQASCAAVQCPACRAVPPACCAPPRCCAPSTLSCAAPAASRMRAKLAPLPVFARVQDFFQVFAWTQSSEEQQVERRNRLLLDTGSSRGGWPGLHSQASVAVEPRTGTTVRSGCGSPQGWAAHPAAWRGPPSKWCMLHANPPARSVACHAACQPTCCISTHLLQVSFTQMVESAAAYLPGKLAELAGMPDVEAAAAKLREELCFCMETAVKLFFWMRLACEWRTGQAGLWYLVCG